MSFVMCIGGGSFQKGETKVLDEYVIQYTKKQMMEKRTPKVLFLPTASRDDQGYAKRFKQYYRSLGCEVEALRLGHTKLNKEEIRNKILTCDILYIGGGNLSFLMEKVKEKQVDQMIREAYIQGISCVGLSAGASLFYTYGYSDLNDDGRSYGYVKGLDILSGIFCPHCEDFKRKNFFQEDNDPYLKRYGCKDGQAYLYEEGHMRKV